ncbi:hypothetical protein ACFYOY_13440 [Streptomyces sp. NPDC007875]|uniref:hypothetical protein n=1 Tax=Streptomyces sp. NPDC007875 TaxID=3364783 RepID=UPI0036816DDB
MASFVIVTEDGSCSEGEEMSFPELLVGRVRLESYSHEGDYVVLHFEGGVEMAVPESRVQHIVYRKQVA